MRVQRMRVTFGRDAALKFITHLDLMRFWERALRRAALPVAYSEGFSPHPQISLAAPLPVGVTATAELMDIYLSRRMAVRDFQDALAVQSPPGLELKGTEEVALSLPSIQSQLRAAEYRIGLPVAVEAGALEDRVRDLLARESIPWQHMREKELRRYDLRPLIEDLRVERRGGQPQLVMRLQTGNTATGRPDQVIAALELPSDLPVERTALILSEIVEAGPTSPVAARSQPT